jgi:hypothetical protein
MAALAVSGAALCAAAQNKVSTRPEARDVQSPNAAAAPKTTNAASTSSTYFYEFTQPDFIVSHVVIEHDDSGKGSIKFERRGDAEAITEPLQISPSALGRINGFYETLGFLDSTADYKSKREYPSYGKTVLRVRRGDKERTAELNYPEDQNAFGLMQEYRRLSEQAVFVFELNLAVEIQPLETPKLMNKLETLMRLNYISDPKQLYPLIRQLSTDERLPLIARNHATRLLKKLEK